MALKSSDGYLPFVLQKADNLSTVDNAEQQIEITIVLIHKWKALKCQTLGAAVHMIVVVC